MNEPVKPLDPDKGAATVLSEIPRHPSDHAVYAQVDEPLKIPRLNTVLFLLTLLTTTMAGAYTAGGNFSLLKPISSIAELAGGLSFSIPLMLILLAHELGHYFTARHHRVDASLPYFVPAPFPSFFFIGTFGAFIKMRSMPNSRRVMFDIGAAGPWAGMLIALPATIIGLQYSTISPLDTSAGGLNLGNSLLFLGLSHWILGVDPNLVNVNLHPIAFAGWLGFFVTALNLLPSGQLDGGHVVYALFGRRRHRMISRCAFITAVLMVLVPLVVGWDYWAGWWLWAVLLLILGLGHPVTVDAETPLDSRRRVAAWLTVALFIVTFAPVPFSIAPPSAPDKDKVYDVMQHQAAPPSVPRTPLHGRQI
jgi:membrane-associated protease RseP (regulator of RpoE activity)